jgi:hypothetical protein
MSALPDKSDAALSVAAAQSASPAAVPVG